MRCTRGFSLIELMVVVAIIGVLAAIAIPNFLAMQLRTKRAELPTNLDAIRTAEGAYYQEWDTYTGAALTPPTMPGRNPIPFAGGGMRQFDLLGWMADGKVRGQYSTRMLPSTSIDDDHFQGNARCDVDGDRQIAVYLTSDHDKPFIATSNNIY